MASKQSILQRQATKEQPEKGEGDIVYRKQRNWDQINNVKYGKRKRGHYCIVAAFIKAKIVIRKNKSQYFYNYSINSYFNIYEVWSWYSLTLNK